MSVIATYICDRCSKKYENDPTKATDIPVPMKLVGIRIAPLLVDNHRYLKPVVHHQQMWCDECIAQYNLNGLLLKFEADKPKFTLEDHIKEIVTHAIQEKRE